MTISLAHPEALLLLPLWAAAAWLFPRARLWHPLRLSLGVLLLLAWANPHVPMQQQGLDVWVLVDHSDSTRDTLQPRLPEMQTLLEQSRSAHDRLFFIDFAEDVIQRDIVTATVLSGRTDATHLAKALDFTLMRLQPNRHSRLLVLTDGYSTEPLEEAALQVQRSGVPMDLRLFGPEQVMDFQVDRLTAPLRVRPGEPFLVETVIRGTHNREVPVELLRDGVTVAQTTAVLRRGQAQLRWTQRLDRAGAVEYTVRIHPEEDAWPGNNEQRHWVEAGGGRRVLLATAYSPDPMAEVLQRQGHEVEVVTVPEDLRPAQLSGVAAVILNNVSAFQVPPLFLDALPFFVQEQGGGLLMIGGRASFASGGYFQSAIDPLLPVSMELKQDHRRLATAMAIVMDRSGSMNASVPGAPGTTKMRLANEGAAQAIELLGDFDAVTVFAVDTQPHVVVPLTTLSGNRQPILDAVRRIQSLGGGIFVYEGLKAGWAELQKAQQGQRHIILFSDASDSERPEGYERIVDEMLREGATLSVIALGSERDRHADLLKEIAARGQGRILFNEDASQLPQLFAQETVTLSRSAFLREPVGLAPHPGWREIAATPLRWPAEVDGYNLSYLRPGASASLLSQDEYAAPLLAHWQLGMGRVAAVSFPLGGEYSARIRAWEGYSDFVHTLVSWALRPELPEGVALRQTRIGDSLQVDLFHSEDWESRFQRRPPIFRTVDQRLDEPQTRAWTRFEPGRLQTTLPLRGGGLLRGALQLDGQVIPFGPIAPPLGAEWRFDPAMPLALQQLSQSSGGVNRIDLASIWQAPRSVTLRGIRVPLLWTALMLLLVEAAWTRLQGQRIQIDLRRPGHSRKPAIRAQMPAPPVAVPEAVAPSPPPDPAGTRRAVFAQARRRGQL